MENKIGLEEAAQILSKYLKDKGIDLLKLAEAHGGISNLAKSIATSYKIEMAQNKTYEV